MPYQPFNEANEEALLQLIIQGDQRAFSRFYNLFREVAYKYVRQRVQDKDAVDTIVQDSFLILWQRRGKYNSMKYLRCSAYVIMRNRCVAYGKSAYSLIFKGPLALDCFENSRKYAYDPEEEIKKDEEERCARENIELIEKVIRYLPQDVALIEKLLRRGRSHKQIFKLFDASYPLNQKMENAFEKVRVTFKQLKAVANASRETQLTLPPGYESCLGRIELKICKLIYEKGYKMDEISYELNIFPPKVIWYHRRALKKIERMMNRRRIIRSRF